MMTDEESQLDELFQQYRLSCPDVEPGINFMPAVWQKIESRYSFWFVFQRLARTATTGCAAICLILLLLNFTSTAQSPRAAATYTDALLADHSAEKTYYTEAIPAAPAGNDIQETSQH